MHVCTDAFGRIARTPSGTLFEAVQFATLASVDGFNDKRIQEPTGYIPPAKAEHRHSEEPDQAAMAA